MSFEVSNSPFGPEQADLLNKLVPTLSKEQRIWLSGYLAGPSVAQGAEQDVAAEPAQAVATAEKRSITILYGSHTGNCQALSEELAEKLKAKDHDVTLSAMDDFKPKALKKVEDLLVLTSTHGEGDPPDNALSFYDFLHSKRAPKLDNVRFSVLSLGDSSYELFCHTGKEIDQRLEELGAERLYSRVDCDLDFEEPAEEWEQGVLQELEQGQPASAQASSAEPATQTASSFSKKNPFQAEIIENINLNGRGSNKETRHIELDLEGSGLVYQPGDSLGIVPENDQVLVDELIETMGWDPGESVPIGKGETRRLSEALLTTFEITNLTKPLLEKAAALSENDELGKLVQSEDASLWKGYIEGRDLLDLVQDYGPWKGSAQDFVSILRKIPARLYSIASSSSANPDEVHLTISAVRYEAYGRDRKGVCSVQCAERSEPGQSLPVYVQKNDNFRLPSDPSAPIIMVGAGTGVAPYRSFLEEREETEAEGDSWLFFGDQHFVTDFLYQTDWQGWLKEGVLSKMDVAFSRDTEEKVYVQHKMQEKGSELYQWIEKGAHIYVCGDEKYMAKDVEQTLLDILQTEGKLTEEAAVDYLAELRREKRYQRDVY
ncbi:assimilatory sulfite reductase (NADPH) flavoprotein subunit [Halobacillus salinus]|uniref:assimilatory sulfite reductase (NADPH) flavoprotein subunit n=1 Tax=Halobacillus salinus TaxID=192814 RepID=UPI0009A7D03F|nr:assimilatory sulfite reductase (NADPH) flavoprotein subunit [Halobacillus salinus]